LEKHAKTAQNALDHQPRWAFQYLALLLNASHSCFEGMKRFPVNSFFLAGCVRMRYKVSRDAVLGLDIKLSLFEWSKADILIIKIYNLPTLYFED
jgi:hypothetical protein